MDSRLPRRANKTAAGVAVATGLVLALAAGTAQADGPNSGSGSLVERSPNRVILKNNVGAAATATLALPASAPRLVNGAGAKVSAQYSCPSGYDGYLDIQLVESAGGHVTQSDGSNSRALTCNGAKHTMAVSVVVSNDWPFKAGKTFARAILVAFNNATGDQATAYTERTITLS